ncbi:unnamed protein product [Schistocephalus solidus]|uniref:Uncharacterized protein n=1 Tax=Schistocephalus solidus TaxID=70667 RepID=A0A183SKJ5_SCHSO|nr:unnamed protein product [Schistocephalus solidus]
MTSGISRSGKLEKVITQESTIHAKHDTEGSVRALNLVGLCVDFQRHLRVLPWQAYPHDSFTNLEIRILEKFVNGISLPEFRPKFVRDLPGNIMVALDLAWRVYVIHTACPFVQESSSLAFGFRQAPAAIQDTSVDVFAMEQRRSRDIGTQTAQRHWGPHSTPLLGAALLSHLSLARLSIASSMRELESTTCLEDQPSVFPTCCCDHLT